MSRRQNPRVGYRPAPRRGFLPRAWRRSACASSSSPELRYTVLMHAPDLLWASVGGRLERLAGRGPPEGSGKRWRSDHTTAIPPSKRGESPDPDRYGTTWFISPWRSVGAFCVKRSPV